MNTLAKRALPVLVCTACLSGPAAAGFTDELLKQVGGALGTGENVALPAAASSSGPTSPTQSEMSGGLKEALSAGVKQAISLLGRDGGFLNDPSVRIPMPDSLTRVEKVLRVLHQDRLADQFVATMNHAAEQAVPQAADIFADAIGSMTLEDAEAIVKGPDDAATRYFRSKSEARLTERFRPIVAEATSKAGVTATYKKMMGKAGPAAQFLGSAQDLDGYVTAKALDGLYAKIALEEKAIRTNPAARTTRLLKKVFGSLGKQTPSPPQ